MTRAPSTRWLAWLPSRQKRQAGVAVIIDGGLGGRAALGVDVCRRTARCGTHPLLVVERASKLTWSGVSIIAYPLKCMSWLGSRNNRHAAVNCFPSPPPGCQQGAA